jgi:hypothetical protein
MLVLIGSVCEVLLGVVPAVHRGGDGYALTVVRAVRAAP